MSDLNIFLLYMIEIQETKIKETQVLVLFKIMRLEPYLKTDIEMVLVLECKL